MKLLSAFNTFSSKKCTRVLRFILSVQVNLFGHLLVLAGNPVSVLMSLKKKGPVQNFEQGRQLLETDT